MDKKRRHEGIDVWQLGAAFYVPVPLVPLIFLGMTKVATQIMRAAEVPPSLRYIYPPTLWIFQFNQGKALRSADDGTATCSFVI